MEETHKQFVAFDWQGCMSGTAMHAYEDCGALLSPFSILDFSIVE